MLNRLRRQLTWKKFVLQVRKWLENLGLLPFSGWASIKLFVVRIASWIVHLPRLILGFVLFQIALMAALFLYAKIRKRAVENPFPQLDIPPTPAGDHTLHVFDDGGSVFKSMLQDINQAREVIFMESYIFEADEVGETFRRALLRKARAGVKVYVIFDGIGSLHVPERFKRFGRHKNIKVFEYGRLRTLKSFFDLKMWVRNHRKILVVDGKIAYLGGINIGRNYEKTWRDTHLKIAGPIAQNAACEFIDLWNTYNKRRKIRLEYPHVEADQIEIISNDPFKKRLPIRQMYLDAINNAKRNIYITNAYFLPDSEIRQALMDASKRGVDVQVIVPQISDNIVVDWITRGIATMLLPAKITMLFYKGTMVHAKTMTIDSEWSTVGSANIDGRSLGANYEINAIIRDVSFARQMEAMFLNDRVQCVSAQLPQWGRRNPIKRFGETVLQPVRGLF